MTPPNGPPRRVADVLLRALPAVTSLDELADLRALADAHYPAGLPRELERAMRLRRRELPGAGPSREPPR